jgi:hypothetical protein
MDDEAHLLHRLTFYIDAFQKQCVAAGHGREAPFCAIVDSLLGKATAMTKKKIDETGAPGLSFPVETNYLNMYMKSTPDKLLDWPMTWLGVNHLKIKRDAVTGAVDYHSPGGKALRFQSGMTFEMDTFKTQETAKYRLASLRIRTFKNSYGPKDIRINVGFKTWYQDDGPEGETVRRLHSRFEWWAGSIMLLCKCVGQTKTVAGMLQPRLKEVCDVHEKKGGSKGTLYWSNRLGVTSSDAMPAHDLGMLLEQSPNVLADLYPVLGIQRRPFFKPGVDYLGQLDDYEHVVLQAAAAQQSVDRARALQDQALALGPTLVRAPGDMEEED